MEERIIRVLRGWYKYLKVRAQNGALLNTAGERFRKREMRWDGDG